MNDFEHDLMSHYHLGDFRNYSKERLRAIALCAEVGLPLYKIRHSSAVADTAVVIAREVKAQLRISVDEEICELGGMLHDIGISQILTDDKAVYAAVDEQAALDALDAFKVIIADQEVEIRTRRSLILRELRDAVAAEQFIHFPADVFDNQNIVGKQILRVIRRQKRRHLFIEMMFIRIAGVKRNQLNSLACDPCSRFIAQTAVVFIIVQGFGRIQMMPASMKHKHIAGLVECLIHVQIDFREPGFVRPRFDAHCLHSSG